MEKIPGLFVAGSEPAALRRIGVASNNMTERHGVDVLWGTEWGLVGVQRKELTDLVASMQDGRLRKEVAQMNGVLTHRMVLVEGFGKWTSDGELVHGYTKVSRRQVRGFLWSIRLDGIWVEWTENLNDTIAAIRWFVEWTRKDKHTSLVGRAKPRGNWGKADDRAWQVHLLTSLDGVGPALAERIIDHFGGVPMRWEVGAEELLEVPGIGKGRVEKMMRALTNAPGYD